MSKVYKLIVRLIENSLFYIANIEVTWC